MPIYAYRCSACGFQNDYLQKVTDPVLSTCPECGAHTFAKQLTAAGFQLKGSGWYATDFKNSGTKPAAKPNGDGTPDAKPESGSDSKPDSKPESKPDAGAAPSCGTGACPACS